MDKLTKEEIEKRVHEVAGGKGHLTFDEFMGLAKEFLENSRTTLRRQSPMIWIMEKITIDHNIQSPIIKNFPSNPWRFE